MLFRLLFISLLASCVAPREIRQKARAERLVDKAIRLNPAIESTQTDTVYSTITLRDTIRTVRYDTDTVVINPTEGDTIRVKDSLGRADAYLVWHTFSPTLGLRVNPQAIPVEITGQVPVSVTTTTVTRSNWWRWIRSGYRWLLIIAIVAVLLAVLRVIGKI